LAAMRILPYTRLFITFSVLFSTAVLPREARSFVPVTSSEDQLSTSAAGSQAQPRIASFADGTYLVTWVYWGGGIVKARRFDAAGYPLGPEFDVLTLSTGKYSVAPRSDKGFVVVGNVARIFGPNDAQIGADIPYNADVTFGYHNGSVAVHDDGRFLIAWTFVVDEPFEYDVHARVYDALGSPLTPEFRVNVFEPEIQSHPLVTVTSAGNFAIAWGDREQDGTFFSVYARLYDVGGNALTGEFLVNESATGLQLPTSIAATPAGGFVVAWYSDDDNSYLRRYDAAAEPLGPEVRINIDDAGTHVVGALSIRADGTVLVVWAASYGDPNLPVENGRIFGRLYDAALQPLTDPFQINGFDLDAKGASGAFLPNTGDSFHVVWDIDGPHLLDGSGSGVFSSLGCIGDGPDSDGDGTGDSCDPCSAGAAFDRADRSRFRFINDLFGGDRYAFVGEFDIGSRAEWDTIDPEALLRIRVEGDRRRPLIDADLSSSGRWSGNGSSSKWTYRDRSAAIDGVTRAQLQFLPGDGSRVRVKITGKNAHYGIARDEAQQTVTVTYGEATAGECARVEFLESECAFDGLGRGFSCDR
jgi:hypothetical protein